MMITAFGVVYKAEWRGITVAVKQIQQVDKMDEFVEEVELMQSLVHKTLSNANTPPSETPRKCPSGKVRNNPLKRHRCLDIASNLLLL
jgi:hypothetical protein